MKLVQDWADIRRNLVTLDGYRSSADQHSREFFRDTSRDGFCFVLCEVSGRRLFGPSRFIGYLRNTRRKHRSSRGKSGIDTNQRIQRILHTRFEPSASREAAFLAFCKAQGITPRDNKRKFIHYGEEITPDDVELAQDDIEEIEKDRRLVPTEKKQLTLARLGQGEFRRRVWRHWRRCPVTHCSVQVLLRASHIKPWRACSNQERLDGFNGLLLAPQVDAAFDRGLISFGPRGHMLLSRRLAATEARRLGIRSNRALSFTKRHQTYLEYHRKHVFIP